MALELKGITSGYGETQVLWGVDMKCEDRELTVVVGPNGAGKSTTLRVVNGLLKAWEGSVTRNGEDITDLKAYERVDRGIASVPEGRMLFPLLTTKENLRLGAYSRRARNSIDDSFKIVYEFFPRLKEREKVKAGKLSGGEQQMAGIGRALMAKPTILVLDEPSLGLAPKLVLEIFKKIRALKESGLTVLMVEQNAYRALDVSDHAYVMQEGKVVNSGHPSELMNIEELRKAYFSIT